MPDSAQRPVTLAIPDLDWGPADISTHRQVAILGAARALLEIIGPLDRTRIDPVIPMRGGREVWIFQTPSHHEGDRRLVKRLPEGEMTQPLDYDAPQSLRIYCRRPNAARRLGFNLDGAMSHLDHALLLTALGGIPGGANLRDFGFTFSGPGYFILNEVHRRSPVLTDCLTGDPMLGDTMTPFLATARESFNHKALRQDFFA